MADLIIGIILIAAVAAVIWMKRREKKLGMSVCGGCCGSWGIECNQRNGKEDEAVKRRDAK